MIFCVYCGKSFESKMKFCPYCGKEQPLLETLEAQPYAPEAPTSPPVTAAPYAPHTAYSFESVPQLSRPAKLLGKLSFIAGLVSMILGAILDLTFLILSFSDLSINFSVSYEPFTLILGVGAIVLSVLARKKGNYQKQTTLGRIFGIVGIVLGAISIILFLVFVTSSFEFPELPDFSL